MLTEGDLDSGLIIAWKRGIMGILLVTQHRRHDEFHDHGPIDRFDAYAGGVTCSAIECQFTSGGARDCRSSHKEV